MPTTANHVYFVDTASSTGGDGTTDAITGPNRAFASIADAEANILTAHKDIGTGFYTAILCNNAGGADTNVATFSVGDWTTGGTTGRLYIMSNDNTNANTDPLGVATKTCHQDGTYGAGYIVNVFDACIAVDSAINCTVQGVEVDGDGRTFRRGISLGDNSAIINCIAHSIDFGVRVFKGTIENTLASDCRTSGYEQPGNFGNTIYKNCTAINNTGNGIESTSGGTNLVQVINCDAFGNGTNYDDNGAGWRAGSENNAGETGDTIPGTGSVTGLTSADYLDYAGSDFRHGAASALTDAGGTNGTTFDVAGTLRAIEDIGFFEFAAAGGSLDANTALATWTGQQATLTPYGALDANTALATWTGQQATLAPAAGTLDANTALANWTGQQATLTPAGALDANTALATWTGQQATLTPAGVLNANTAQANWVGLQASLEGVGVLDANTALATWTGQQATLTPYGALDANTALVTWTGEQATLAAPGLLDANTALTSWTGQMATLGVPGIGISDADKEDIVDRVFARVLEGGETFGDMVRILRAVAAGDIVQQPNGDYVIKSLDGLTNRIEGEPDANNGRNVTAVDGTDPP